LTITLERQAHVRLIHCSFLRCKLQASVSKNLYRSGTIFIQAKKRVENMIFVRERMKH